jgi:hypothetical protein
LLATRSLAKHHGKLLVPHCPQKGQRGLHSPIKTTRLHQTNTGILDHIFQVCQVVDQRPQDQPQACDGGSQDLFITLGRLWFLVIAGFHRKAPSSAA